jgi:hypothetical protein
VRAWWGLARRRGCRRRRRIPPRQPWRGMAARRVERPAGGRRLGGVDGPGGGGWGGAGATEVGEGVPGSGRPPTTATAATGGGAEARSSSREAMRGMDGEIELRRARICGQEEEEGGVERSGGGGAQVAGSRLHPAS